MGLTKYVLHFQGKEADKLVPPYIFVKATGSSSWNDFLFNYQALIEVVPTDDRAPFSAPAYVMPTDDEKSARRLATWIHSNESARVIEKTGNIRLFFEDGKPTFLSLLDGHQYYQDLSTWCQSPQERNEILQALNDVVFLRNSSFHLKEVLAELLQRQSFALGVLRSPTTFRALRRGWRALQAQPIATLDDARKDLNFIAELHGFNGSKHDLSIKFQNVGIFEDRAHCLIGVNGSGKTRLMRELALNLGKQFAVNEGSSVFVSDDQSESVIANSYRGLAYNRVLVFSADGEIRYPIAVKNDTAFEYQYFNLIGGDLVRVESAELKTQMAQNNQTLMVSQSTMASVVVEMLRDRDVFTQREGIDLTRFDILRKAIDSYVNIESLYLPLMESQEPYGTWTQQDESGQNWVKAVDLLRMNEQRILELTSKIEEESELAFFTQAKNSSKIRKIYLSSGQLIYFRFALRFISSIDKSALVLIDEPETHLHPNLICDFMSLLYEVLTATKSIALIATHSTYVVREVPTHCVHIFDLNEELEKINIRKVRLKTLGASVDSLSQAVFGDATAKKYHEKIAREIAESGLSEEQILERYEKILSPEMLIEIETMMSQGD